MAVEKKALELPPGYELDYCDADVWVLRRVDGSEVAVFSAGGCDPRLIEAAAREDARTREG